VVDRVYRWITRPQVFNLDRAGKGTGARLGRCLPLPIAAS
jgi:hypothetical protein